MVSKLIFYLVLLISYAVLVYIGMNSRHKKICEILWTIVMFPLIFYPLIFDGIWKLLMIFSITFIIVITNLRKDVRNQNKEDQI